MESTISFMVMGPLLIGFTALWFSVMFWVGMRMDDTPRRPTRKPAAGEPGPWWTNDRFGAVEPVRVPAEFDQRER